MRCSAAAPHAVIRSICTTQRHEQYLHDIQSLQDLGQALIGASRAGSSELVQALIGSAADPNSRGPSKCSCTHWPRCITFVDAAGSTSLHAAAHNGHLECAQLLVEAAANPSVADHEGLTAIHQAALASSQVIPSHLGGRQLHLFTSESFPSIIACRMTLRHWLHTLCMYHCLWYKLCLSCYL